MGPRGSVALCPPQSVPSPSRNGVPVAGSNPLGFSQLKAQHGFSPVVQDTARLGRPMLSWQQQCLYLKQLLAVGFVTQRPLAFLEVMLAGCVT